MSSGFTIIPVSQNQKIANNFNCTRIIAKNSINSKYNRPNNLKCKSNFNCIFWYWPFTRKFWKRIFWKLNFNSNFFDLWGVKVVKSRANEVELENGYCGKEITKKMNIAGRCGEGSFEWKLSHVRPKNFSSDEQMLTKIRKNLVTEVIIKLLRLSSTRAPFKRQLKMDRAIQRYIFFSAK